MEDNAKFSHLTIETKERLKNIRIDAGFSMNEGAEQLGITRKHLEDIEALRPYGCHIELEILARYRVVYSCGWADILPELPPNKGVVKYLQRPRVRHGSTSRTENKPNQPKQRPKSPLAIV